MTMTDSNGSTALAWAAEKKEAQRRAFRKVAGEWQERRDELVGALQAEIDELERKPGEVTFARRVWLGEVGVYVAPRASEEEVAAVREKLAALVETLGPRPQMEEFGLYEDEDDIPF